MKFCSRQIVTLLLQISVTNAFVVTPRLSFPSKVATLRHASSPHLKSNPVNITCSVDKASHFVEVFTIDDELDLWAQKQSLDAMRNGHDTASEHSMVTFSPDLTPIKKDDDNHEVWKARLLLILAAALYGTNFSFVKVLGEEMPVSISAAVRFGLASLVTLPWLFQGASKDSNSARGAILAGFEVGIWNSIGYISQALGLATTAAGKVRINECKKSDTFRFFH
jgi:EamA-like transporter family